MRTEAKAVISHDTLMSLSILSINCSANAIASDATDASLEVPSLPSVDASIAYVLRLEYFSDDQLRQNDPAGTVRFDKVADGL